MCCGSSSFSPATAAGDHALPSQIPELVGIQGMVMLRYNGVRRAAPEPFSGERTGTIYAFGGRRIEGYVDVNDAAAFLTNYRCANCADGKLFSVVAPPADPDAPIGGGGAADDAPSSAAVANAVTTAPSWPATVEKINTAIATATAAAPPASFTAGALQLATSKLGNVEGHNIQGTGAGGNITVKDVRAYLKSLEN